MACPAVGQGIIGIECRDGDANSRSLLQGLNDPVTRTAMDAERAFAGRLGGSCQSPIAAYATLDAKRLTLDGLVAEPDGSRLLRDSITGGAENPAPWARNSRIACYLPARAALLERLRTPRSLSEYST